MKSPSSLERQAAGQFVTTRWSIVLASGGPVTPQSQRALDQLCQIYWPPLYLYLRRSGCSADEAADVVQGFFARLLQKNDLAQVDAARGRFRSFLLAALKHFLANQRKHQRALKRGGGQRRISLDVAQAESLAAREAAAAGRTSDELFDRQWACTLLERVQETLRQEQTAAGKAPRFAVLLPHLAGTAGSTYREAAAELQLSENAVKVAVHRLRQRFKELLRGEIAQTVESEAEIDEEIRLLLDALRR